MEGHVFECYEEQTDRRQFRKTVDALECYAKKTMKYPEDLAPLFATSSTLPVLAKPPRPLPVPPATVAAEDDLEIWKEDLRNLSKRKSVLRGNLSAIHAVIWGQCSEAMRVKLRSIDGYEENRKADDCKWFLSNIQAVTMQFDTKHNGYISMLDATAGFVNCRQQRGQSVSAYLEVLKSFSDTIEYHGGTIVLNPDLAPTHDADGRALSQLERHNIARDCTLGAALIRGADKERYGTLIQSLKNRFSSGKDEYPTDETAAYSLLTTYRTPTNTTPRQARNHNADDHTVTTQATVSTSDGSGVTFAQRGAGVPGTNGVLHENVLCYRCNVTGHYACDCPAESASTATGTTLVQHAHVLAHGSSSIDPSWILLDSQSTISVFKNCDMLTNIRPSDHVLRAVTNGGFQDSRLVGDFPNLGEVWFNPASIANILSLSHVRRVCRVTMDTSLDSSLIVHRVDGSQMVFREHPCGLFVFDPSINDSNAAVSNYTMLSTVRDNKKMFTPRDVVNADAARRLYRLLGRLSDAEFLKLLGNGSLLNCPVTVADAQRANAIYGPDVASLKGKTTRTGSAPRVPALDVIPLPPHISSHYRNVVLCIDFLFVQGHPFFHTISRDLQFRTIAAVPDRKHSTILTELQAVIKLYAVRGFIVCDIHADTEFECIRADVLPIHLDVVPADDHVGEVERSNRTVKERARACVHGLPFRRIPKLLVVSVVAEVVRCLNMLPAPHGVSQTLSPLSIVTGAPGPDYNAMQLEFGSYVQLFDDADPTNTLRSRTFGAISLNPTGNLRGDYYFLSLASGARVSRHRYQSLPIPDTAIARVEALAKSENQPLLQERGLVVEWRPDHPIDEDEYDRDFLEPPEPDDDSFHADDYSDVDVAELADLDDGYDDPPGGDAAGPNIAPALPPAPTQGADEEPAPPPTNEEEADFPMPDLVEHVDREDDDDADDEQGAPIAEHPEEGGAPIAEHPAEEGAQNSSPRYNLRTRTNPRNSVFQSAMDEPHSSQSYFPPMQMLYKDIFGYIMTQAEQNTEFAITLTQMSANAGLKKFGKKAEEALLAEFAQLEDLEVYEPLDPSKLTRAQRKSALRAINLIKEKRCGRLKGRTVADGRSQKSLYDKSETASPTVATDPLMVSIIIDAFEKRDVATADIAGAYLKAYMKDFTIMKFTGPSVDILCGMKPEYKAFVTVENGARVLYVKLLKALYGCVQSALLWYQMFYTYLKNLGFELNPYDPCVANKMIDGKQCTIAWYVDDTKISHADPAVVSQIIDQLEERFGKMTVTRGKKHVFLGMNVTYTPHGTAEIIMRDYLEEAIAESKLDVRRTASSPARRDLFEIDEASPPLEADDAEVFHSVVAKLLYVSLRARGDILLAISFLCTRVSKCTKQDQAKLKRVLEYLNGTLHYKYILGADDLKKLRTWVDASYAVHPDMKSHTGGVMSFGLGGFVCKSSKQKLNTKSSTEAEVVGASDYLPNTLWIQMFLADQGYVLDSNILEQDNESAMRLEKNGRMSAGQKSRHINIRYFWIKDRTEQNNIEIRHCPTLEMLADFFTKPLQGHLFRRFRDVVLGHCHVNTLRRDFPASSEERVEEGRAETDETTVPSSTVTVTQVTSARNELVGNNKRKSTYAEVVRGHKRQNEIAESSLVVSNVLNALSRNNPV
jgi:Reverse transcriptase (RNA-dependent DNA polymerase)